MPEGTFGGPYIQVAAICTTPLIEQSGYLSVIRIQDRIQLAGITDQMKPQPLGSLFLVLALKAGELNGKYMLQITPITPSTKRLPGLSFSVLFEGQERGAILTVPLNIVAEEEGLYWFEITLEDMILTKIPLRVMYQKLSLPGILFPPQGG